MGNENTVKILGGQVALANMLSEELEDVSIHKHKHMLKNRDIIIGLKIKQ